MGDKVPSVKQYIAGEPMTMSDEVKSKENMIVQKTIEPFLKKHGFLKKKKSSPAKAKFFLQKL